MPQRTGGTVAAAVPLPPPHGGVMTEPQEQDETTEAPVSPETVVDDAEAEEAENEPEQPADEATEAPAEDVETQQMWERRFDIAERRFKTYRAAVEKEWAEDAVHLLPVSISPSAPPGYIDVRDAGRVPQDVQQPILEFFGFAREQDYEPDPDARECPVCKGKGWTRLPTQVPGKDKRACPRCLGEGYVMPDGSVVTTTTNGHADNVTITSDFPPAKPTDTDEWGESRILPNGAPNPNYGKMPQHKVAVEPWGITAGLTAQDARS